MKHFPGGPLFDLVEKPKDFQIDEMKHPPALQRRECREAAPATFRETVAVPVCAHRFRLDGGLRRGACVFHVRIR